MNTRSIKCSIILYKNKLKSAKGLILVSFTSVLHAAVSSEGSIDDNCRGKERISSVRPHFVLKLCTEYIPTPGMVDWSPLARSSDGMVFPAPRKLLGSDRVTRYFA